MIRNNLAEAHAKGAKIVRGAKPGNRMRSIWLPGALICCALLLAGCRTPAPVRGLRPVYPPVRYGIADLGGPPEVIFVEVDSNQPTLKWQAFPGKADRKAAEDGILNGIERVRYDLRIWHVGNDGAPVVLVYERRKLPNAEHKVETILPHGRYCWTLRASFDLNGQKRVTPWSFCLWPWTMADARMYGVQYPQRIDQVSTANYYRFETP